jgi:hypothetical protein
MNDSTLISNLPDRTNGTAAQNHLRNPNQTNINMTKKNNSTETNSNTYVPMNVHDNPYGFKNDIDVAQNQQDSTQHRLPSRDIPIDQTKYTQDQSTKANYIDEPKNIQDYIQDYKEEESERTRKHNYDKNKISQFDKIVSETQEFLLIAILYFISDMTIVNILIKRYLSILGIVENDGNFNMYGKIFKSVSFAFLYYLSFQAINNLFPTI